MHCGNFVHDEPEITGDMPAEPCSVLAFPQEKNAVPAQVLPAREILPEEEEPTIVEFLKRGPGSSWFYQFIFSPHYKTALSIELHRYLLRVKLRVRQSRQSHRLLYPDSGFQKIRRLLERALRHAKKNLAVK
ncbi:MAG: hypothetical protein IT572_06330 [Deltaproteobacteria bacterium]|nr:hypothetical protein [Deltaproteobacteria bacterium]